MKHRKAIEDRFWSKVDVRGPDECWEWQAGVNTHGYGNFSVNGRTVSAHRFARESTRGTIDSGSGYHGTCVLHTCDNRRCCNPSHLTLGSALDNSRDAVAKGRSARNKGERNGQSMLTEGNIRDIFTLDREGCRHKHIAMLMRCSVSHVENILYGQRWSHLGLSEKRRAA